MNSITAPDGGTLSFAYNTDLLTSTNWGGSILGTVTRSYDTDRRITSLGVNGDNVSFTYDADGLLSQAGSLTVSREAGSGLISGTGLGTVTTTRSYNAFGELNTETATSGASTLYDVAYTRDKLGRITQKVESIQGQTLTTTYGYDLAGRLSTVTENGVTTTYSYDANGNRLNQVRGGTTKDKGVKAL